MDYIACRKTSNYSGKFDLIAKMDDGWANFDFVTTLKENWIDFHAVMKYTICAGQVFQFHHSGTFDFNTGMFSWYKRVINDDISFSSSNYGQAFIYNFFYFFIVNFIC